MKRFLILAAVIFLLPCFAANAQMIVAAPVLEALMTKTGFDQAIYYGSMITNQLDQLFRLTQQAESMIKQTELVVKNWENIGDITSFQDFMDWYNRQLYLEQMAVNTFNSMNVSIGKKNYKITDIEGMAYGINDTFVDYWEKDFTPEQRREMWLGLGMTPSNYAYVQTWKEKEKNLARKFLTSSAVVNNEYMATMVRNNKILNRLAFDREMPFIEKMGEKELLAYLVEMSVYSNKTNNDIVMALLDLQEWFATEAMLKKDVKSDPPAASEDFNEVYFERLKP